MYKQVLNMAIINKIINIHQEEIHHLVIVVANIEM